MLVITMKEGTVGRKEHEWHIGEPRPSGLNLLQVQEIQADGDELDHIKRNFDNLPIANHVRVVRWYSEHARFILSHL